MTKNKLVWTKDRLLKLDKLQLINVRDNAKRLGFKETAELCEAVLAEAYPHARPTSRSVRQSSKRPDAFVFTWKPDKWPYAELKALVDEFVRTGNCETLWRCASYRQVWLGARAIFFKQGIPDRGVFGLGEVVGDPILSPSAGKGQGRYSVKVRILKLVDPTKSFMLPESEIKSSGLDAPVWNSRSSGIPLDDKLADAIFAILS